MSSLTLSCLLSCPLGGIICHARISQDPFLFVVVHVAAVRELIANKTQELYTVVRSQLLNRIRAPESVCKTTLLPVNSFLLRPVAVYQTCVTRELDGLGKELVVKNQRQSIVST